jgi:hypothetical protein
VSNDTLGFGAMLFGPEHALQVAADAIESGARSPDMAVGIVLGVKASIVEYNRLFTSVPGSPESGQETAKPVQTPESKSDKPKDLARR